MGSEAAFVLILLLTIGIIVAGIILINLGMNPKEGEKRDLKLVKTGWLMIGIYSVFITACLVWLSIESGLGVVFLIFVLPLIILVGQVLNLTFGIYYLVLGYKKTNPDLKKRQIGWVFITIHLVIVTTIITLLSLFMSGIIPIRLM